jgi:hypothetical protein
LETLSQSVDVTAFSSQIDAGAAKSIFSALLQSRSTGGIIDTAKTNLSFVDGGGGQLESVTFEDTDVTTFDWEQVLDERVVPVGTRSIEITLEATRTGGVSTDAFFDNFSLNVTPRCDFNVDAFCDIDDIDALIAEIVAGTDNAIFDLTGDGQVTLADVTDDNDGWLRLAGEQNLGAGRSYLPADITLDGFVDGLDFIDWNDSKFMNTGLWSLADLNADGFTDGLDFIIWNDFKFMGSDVAAVPEPSWMIMLASAMFCLMRQQRRQ